ncbi:MAG: hypothetical protein JSS83_20965 [Cyanobacteria bacterium SZAS LIN-3]|nr:hypothetical protein [Cyanobacteria bacterium SZAS LIN-3]
MTIKLSVLLIDDDKNYRDQIPALVGDKIDDTELKWVVCSTFEDGLKTLSDSRFDAVISDLFQGPIEAQDAAGLEIVDTIRGKQFCPIVLVSAGKKPEELELSAFVEFVSKVGSYDEKIKEVLKHLPPVVRKLHDEIDSHGGSYLWAHLDKVWDKLKDVVSDDPHLLERLIRRRLAVQISRMLDDSEIETVKGLEFYLYPPISTKEYRLGDVLKHKNDKNDFRVVLTPHCQLTVQANELNPKADFVLTVKALDAPTVLSKWVTKPTKFEDPPDFDSLRRVIKPEPEVGKPLGRYWFLPNFLDIPALYCDFLQVESVSMGDLNSNYDRIATLDTPFAESLQSCFAGFYSSVGTPNLVGKDFEHMGKAAKPLIEKANEAKQEATKQEAAERKAAKEAAKLEAARTEATSPEAAKPEAAKQESVKQEATKQEADQLTRDKTKGTEPKMNETASEIPPDIPPPSDSSTDSSSQTE